MSSCVDLADAAAKSRIHSHVTNVSVFFTVKEDARPQGGCRLLEEIVELVLVAETRECG